MVETIELSPVRFYEEAKKKLEKKDLIEFVSNVSNAVLLSGKDKEMLAKTTYLRAKGLINFYQHSKALEYIDEALKYNTGSLAFELRKYKGLAKGYLGEVNEALKLFRELITETNDINLLAGVYINIAWVHFTLTKNTDTHNLEEIKQYLDSVEEHFDSLSDIRKWKLRNTLSVYYFYKKKYDKAIEILENSIKYCKEEDLPDLYNNLAELYLKVSENDDSGNLEVAKEYLEKAEILGSKYKNNLVLGYIFYTKSMIELQEDQLFKALDTLYLSFEFFKDAEATVKACDCIVKINEIMDEYKQSGLKSFKENLKKRLEDTPYCNKV